MRVLKGTCTECTYIFNLMKVSSITASLYSVTGESPEFRILK